MSLADRVVLVNTISVPGFFYGTAWKEERTEELTYQALCQGFRAIDTANQRRHYFEEGVGKGLKRFLATGQCRRDEIFLQTKFTYAQGQDHRLPYNDQADYATQVRQSFSSSLEHLGVDSLDSLLLHGPFSDEGLAPEDWLVWQTMENLQRAQKVRLIGVSNFRIDQLRELYKRAHIKPSFVQNRCFAVTGWDQEIRRFCLAKNIAYQGFSLLTANRPALDQPLIHELARKYDKTPAQIVFRFSTQVGMIPLTGTSDPDHMQQDLLSDSFDLSTDELERIESLAL